MAHRGEAPQASDDGIAATATQTIDQPAGKDDAKCIGDLKCRKNIAVLNVVETDRGFDRGPARQKRLQMKDATGKDWFEDREDLTVHVVDGRRHKKHGADGPAA